MHDLLHKKIIENVKRLNEQFSPKIISSNSNLLKAILLAYSTPLTSPISYLLQKPFKSAFLSLNTTENHQFPRQIKFWCNPKL